ncbi:MAG: glycoside hydrolase family 28 protein [Acidobacteriaceae bacterium]
MVRPIFTPIALKQPLLHRRFRITHVCLALCLWMAAGAALPALAQDTRTVTEPVIPAVCTSLAAKLTSDHGALPAADESKLDTERIQHALDHCAKGKAVELSTDGSSNAFLTAPLRIPANTTLLVAKGVTLFGSRNPRDYDRFPGSCGIVDHKGHDCKPLILVDHANHAAIMGDGTIDARGEDTLLGSKVTWWDLAEQARAGGRQQCPHLLDINYSNDFTLYRITLKNSPNFHVVFSQGNGFTAWGVKIDTPRHARNTDGIDPSSATNITITHSYISTGDDNVAIKAGSNGPTTHVTVDHDHFYYGHGMSIGSETNGGASAIRVTDLSIDGADNGLRIKSNPSRGGLVRDVTYSDICIRNTRNPILMDTNYNYPGEATDEYPVFTDILLHNVRISGGGKLSFNGFDKVHRLGMQLDGVLLDSPQSYKISARDADIQLGPGATNFAPSGNDVKVTGHVKNGKPESCAAKFVPFPR